MPHSQHDGLANRWFQPLTHVSARGSPRVWPECCQRRIRETRNAHRFVSQHRVLQSVRPMSVAKRPATMVEHRAGLTRAKGSSRMAGTSFKPVLPFLEGRSEEYIKRRLWDKIDVGPDDRCWPWLLSSDGAGYGRIKLKGRYVGTHRLSLAITTGEERLDKLVLHSCDNPICCNPSHLRWGTPKENSDDMIMRGRARPGGNRVFGLTPNARLSWSAVSRIREMRSALGLSYREIARSFGVSGQTIKRVVSYESWKTHPTQEPTP